jgi:hypothetical protein
MKLAKTMRPDQSILVNLSGRGDKDIGTVADLSNADFYCRPSCRGQSVKGQEQPVQVVQMSRIRHHAAGAAGAGPQGADSLRDRRLSRLPTSRPN